MSDPKWARLVAVLVVAVLAVGLAGAAPPALGGIIVEHPDPFGAHWDDVQPFPPSAVPGIVEGPDGFPPAGFDANRPEVTTVAPMPAPLEPVFVDHCASNLQDCARAAGDACQANGLGGAQSAQLAMCPREDGATEGCCTFTCGAQGSPPTGSGTCSAG